MSLVLPGPLKLAIVVACFYMILFTDIEELRVGRAVSIVVPRHQNGKQADRSSWYCLHMYYE